MRKSNLTYEGMLVDYEGSVDILEVSGLKNKGLYYQGCIAVKKELTQDELKCILAEELGHFHTTTGNILDQKKLPNQKQEITARRWAHKRLIPLDRFIDCYKAGCQDRFDTAEFLGVTEEFLLEAIRGYQDIYGTFVMHDDYIIYFDPLGVMKKI